jgi:hypothetical protein
MQVICVKKEREYFFKEDWTGRLSLIRLDNSPGAPRPANPAGDEQNATVDQKSVPNAAHPEDSESFNQLVRTIPLRTEGCVMRNLDRVSGSFLAVIVGGLAILCGGLIFIAIGY